MGFQVHVYKGSSAFWVEELFEGKICGEIDFESFQEALKDAVIRTELSGSVNVLININCLQELVGLDVAYREGVIGGETMNCCCCGEDVQDSPNQLCEDCAETVFVKAAPDEVDSIGEDES